MSGSALVGLGAGPLRGVDRCLDSRTEVYSRFDGLSVDRDAEGEVDTACEDPAGQDGAALRGVPATDDVGIADAQVLERREGSHAVVTRATVTLEHGVQRA